MGQDEDFVQDTSQKGERPGGVFLMRLLFTKPVSMPAREKLLSVLEKRVGRINCICYDGQMAGFSALDYAGYFEGRKVQAQLMIMTCSEYSGEEVDAFTRSQMWDCREERDEILSSCRYQVVATDLLASALHAEERAELDMDFMEALAELYPACRAFYFENCGRMYPAAAVRRHRIPREDRYIYFGMNVRFFRIRGTKDFMVDTVGMNTLFLPDIQYHFHTMDPALVVGHACNLAIYILQNDNPIESGETVDGVEDGRMSSGVRWECRYEESLIQPVREVLDVRMGEYAAGIRDV